MQHHCIEPFERAAARLRSGSIAAQRLARARQMAEVARERRGSARVFCEHLVIQFERAAAHAERSEHWLERAATARRHLASGRFDEAQRACSLRDFPWQRDGFEYFSARNDWCRRFGDERSGMSLTQLDPTQRDRLCPFTPCQRPPVFVFSGNRQAYVGLEHEPASRALGQDLQSLAESYVARAGHAVTAMLQSSELKAVLPVYGALRSRHEQRLIHFALAADPSFVHPSIVALAESVARALLLAPSPDRGWVPKTDRELAATPPFRAVTHSYGSSALIQCITQMRQLGLGFGLSSSSLDRYLARGVCVQLGGYRLDMPATAGPAHHCVLSPLDEIALGSPEDAPRYTSPVVLPDWVWEDLSETDLCRIAENDLETLPVMHRPLRANVELWATFLAGPAVYDATGARVAEFESANGHHIGAYTECVRQRLPGLVCLLTSPR